MRTLVAIAALVLSLTPVAAMQAQYCVASWYSLPGQRMANGEKFIDGASIVAHKTLPLGTQVRITNIDETSEAFGATVCGSVKDRGPYIKGRCVDVSKPLGRILGLIGPGTAKVKVTRC